MGRRLEVSQLLVRQTQAEGDGIMTTSSNYLPFDQAVILMHYKDTRLMEMHTAHGLQWFVLSPGARRKRKSSSHGGRIKPEDAKKILARPDVRGAEDGLFPGIGQTYRMVR
jgi:hypothetical protein